MDPHTTPISAFGLQSWRKYLPTPRSKNVRNQTDLWYQRRPTDTARVAGLLVANHFLSTHYNAAGCWIDIGFLKLDSA